MHKLPVVYHPEYSAPLPDGHRFPMSKFKRLHAHLLDVLGAERLETWHPELPSLDLISTVHDPNFVHDYYYGTLDYQAQRRIGLPWSEALMNRTMTAVGGTILTARLALDFGLALNVAGGTHHAFPAYGSGFCIFNDLAIAIRALQQECLIHRALIIDLDVHQGDGTAFIFSDDSSVYTCSIHCEKNFPGTKRISDLDVGLPEGTGDQDYLATLDRVLEQIIPQAQPELILYNAGVDPHGDDLLGKLNLTNTGLFQRDQRVFLACHAQQIPVACVIGGGYGRNMQALIERHTLLFQAAADVYLS